MVDAEGALGFPVLVSDVRKFGAIARRVFIRAPPFQLQHTFASVVTMSHEEERPQHRHWKRRGEEDKGGQLDRY
jgi:hypothetical protein